MLVSLSIRDVVLIDRLDLACGPGLTVLTGETGAGKSILLEALGLALGGRASGSLVRAGADCASVAAAFALPSGHPAFARLEEIGISADRDEPLVLRRVVGADGRGKAFAADQPVGVAALRAIGDTLVEVHGQFEAQGLLDPATHLKILDAFGVAAEVREETARAHAALAEAEAARRTAEESLAKARAEEDFLRQAVADLDRLAPKADEESALAERRRRLQHGEKLAEAAGAAAEGLAAADAPLASAERALEKAEQAVPGLFAATIAAIDRARIEIDEATNQVAAASAGIETDPAEIEKVEERLFDLRAIARRHGVAVDALPALHREMADRLKALDDGGLDLTRAARAEAARRDAYRAAAGALTAARRRAAKSLETAVAGELPPLRLDKARFVAAVDPREAWGADGADAVRFLIATNPGAEPGPLAKIASGGELARFMLALKVVLAHADPVATLIFDEVDAGIGGATAAAVGERLARLAREAQVLVVTHSPQVAAQGDAHWRVDKSQDKETATTRVAVLDDPGRVAEIARMLAGATLTGEAVSAAEALLRDSRHGR